MNSTQEMIKRLFLSIAISVAALIAGTSSVTADVTRCNENCPPGQVCFLREGTYDTLLVPKGTDCLVAGVAVTVQNVIVQDDAGLLVDRSTFTVNGNINGDALEVRQSPLTNVTIHGNVTITGSRGLILENVNIGGHLHISGSTFNARISVLNSRITGNVLLQNNTTDFRIVFEQNQVVGTLSCHGNNPAPSVKLITGSGQRNGQCKLP